MKNPTVGMRVAYSAAFVRNAGGMDKDVADMRGNITAVKGKFGQHVLVRIRWEDGQESSALDCNLSRATKGKAVQDL